MNTISLEKLLEKDMSADDRELFLTRNIGIIAHIDAGKTTTTERILYYTGMKKTIGEVHDGAATMDWMEQEQERGITITSAVTHCAWSVEINKKIQTFKVNIIDTPGHVDFGIEVERALSVLDGAVLVLESVSGVQTQTITVSRQADKFKIPRIAFINKMDRIGADFYKAVDSIKEKLGKTPVVMTLPVGAESEFTGIIDLVDMKYLKWTGNKGEKVEILDIPSDMMSKAEEYRKTLMEEAASEDEVLMEKFLMGEELTNEEIMASIREAALKNRIIPVVCGSAYKNIGVQKLLDYSMRILPSPKEKLITAKNKEGEEKEIVGNMRGDVCGYAFKIMKDKYAGILCFVRIYSGHIQQGMTLFNTRTQKSFRVGRMVRMHSNKRDEISETHGGDLVAFIGTGDLGTGDTFCGEKSDFALESLDTPEKVIRLAIMPKTKQDQDKMGIALNELAKEDPSFEYFIDQESGQTIIAGMGELHLEIKVDILKREYGIDVQIGRPKVSFRECLKNEQEIHYIHKKQSGGAGQFAELTIKITPGKRGTGFVFHDKIVGGVIPKEYIPSVEKGIARAALNGPISGSEVVDFEVHLIDGSTHSVDSSTLAFELAAFFAFNEALKSMKTKEQIDLLEPIMEITIDYPSSYMGKVSGDLNSKRGHINSITDLPNNFQQIAGEVPLIETFGYINSLREKTEGKGNYSMKFNNYREVPKGIIDLLIEKNKS